MSGVPYPYMQYGCGLSAPKNWRNFDASPTLRLQRLPGVGPLVKGESLPAFPDNVEYGDIIAGLPVPAGSCKGVYCSHVLEHFALEDLRVVLVNTRLYLEPNGIFRFVLPDLEYLAREYLASSDPAAALAFNEGMHMGRVRRATSVVGFAKEWLGSVNHKWMWDYKSMRAELERAGFREIRRAQIGDSRDPRFNEVEDPGRWTNCLGMECMR